MKSIKQLSFIGMVIMFILSSCTMEKRQYMSGYNIDWKNKEHHTDKQESAGKYNEKKIGQNEIITAQQLEYETNTVDNITTANEAPIMASVDNSVIPMITTDEIKYKKCDNLSPIKYQNGTKGNFAPNNLIFSKNASNKTQIDLEDRKGGGFGIASFVISLVGLLVGSIILGPLAIIFGIIGMINRKLKGLAIAGFIIGIIDLLAGLIVLALV